MKRITAKATRIDQFFIWNPPLSVCDKNTPSG